MKSSNMLRSKSFILIATYCFMFVYTTKAACPAHWEERSGFCYFFSDYHITWTAAESKCQQSGGHLVSFATVDEEDWVYTSHIAQTTEAWWIGLNDIATENVFVWSDGTTVNQAVIKWRTDEPNNVNGDEHCVAYDGNTTPANANTFNDETCSTERRFVCKKTPEAVELCDSSMGFRQSGSYCYVYVQQMMNWHEANDYCRGYYDAELTAVTNASEQAYVQSLAQTNDRILWIGLSDTLHPGTFEWSNGQDELVYANFADGEPNNENKGSSCIRLQKGDYGKWNTDRCSVEHSFVCRKGLKLTCPDGWTYGHGKCYKFYLNSNYFVSWDEARDICYAQNAKLLQIESQQEQDFIAGFYVQWRFDGILQLWLGASDFRMDDQLLWADGSAITYTSWDVPPAQALRPGTADCSWLYTGKSAANWELGNCFQQQGFACQVNEGVGLSAFPKPLVNYTCPEEWRLFNDSCYLFGKTQCFWDDCEAFCGQYQGSDGKTSHLASIHSATENGFLAGNLRGQSSIGMTDRATEGIFVWTDGTPSDYYNWKTGQPNADGDCMRLVGIDDDNAWGAWNDRSCTENNYPICKTLAFPQAPQSPPTKDPNPDDSLCGSGYLHSPATHKCYLIVSNVKRPWDDARAHCQQEGGDLLSVNSPDEQDFIQLRLSYQTAVSFWIGGFDTYFPPDKYPNVLQSTGGWEWSDSSGFNYINWDAGQPDSFGDNACIEMRSNDGTWNDLPCTNYLGYICERQDPEHTEPDPVADCTSEDCCFRHLGVEVGGNIADDQLSCSSQMDQYSGAERGRLNSLDQVGDVLGREGGRGAWIADPNEQNPWLQVDFREWTEIRGVVTQGRNGFNQPNNQNNWLKTFSVQYMINPSTGLFEDYKELDGSVAIFKGNYDQDDQITNLFTRPIVTTAIRIVAQECRKQCALRLEVLGCKPSCVQSLGVSPDFVQTDFPFLPDLRFTASSQQTGYEAYNARLDYSEGQVETIKHYTLDGSTMTWDTARAHCVSMGADLCLRKEICPNGIPLITGTVPGDQWAPIRDGVNDWVEIGDGSADRICISHNDNYGPPDWGSTPGECPPWNTPTEPCFLKSNVFCCPVNLKSWKPTANSKNEWVQVDLGTYRKVTGVFVQGDAESDDWITSYYMSFSDDGVSFATYKTPSNALEVFPGNVDRTTPTEGFLREPISTRYIRIQPQSWNNNIAIRMDVVGCEVTDRGDCTDRADTLQDTSFTLTCPAGCDQVTDRLWGTTIYTDDSYICAAAIHDGRVIADHGGTVSVKKTAGQGSYQGTTQHGVTSASYGTWPGSVIFQSDHLGCETGWKGYKDWCYYLPKSSPHVNWADAQQRCRSYDSELVSIHDEAEQAFITQYVLFIYASFENVWLGMTDQAQQNYYQWTDGSDVTFTNWNYKEPNGGHERCVMLYKGSGLWNDGSCDETRNYMCKKEKIPVNQQQQAVDGCPFGWVGNYASCYLFDITESVWVNAESFCQDHGGHLVAISDYYEQAFVISQAAQASHPDDNFNFYIGLTGNIDTTGAIVYSWSSGEPVTFDAWAPDEPYIWHKCVFPFQYEGVEYYDCISLGRPYELFGVPWCSADPVYNNHPVACNGNYDGQVACITLDKQTGLWSQANPIGCGTPQYRICESPRAGYTTDAPRTTVGPTGNCPDGWTGSATGTFCYQINEFGDQAHRLSWEEAKNHCDVQGATLASFHSEAEEEIVANAVQGINGDYSFWIGMKRQPDGNYGWNDLTPITFTDWADGEPNNQNGRENCVEAYFDINDIRWNDLNCDAGRNWVCKVKRGKELQPAVTAPPGTLSPAICGSDVDWVAYTSTYTNVQKCYHFSTSPLKGWQQARDQCQTLGGDLVTVAALDEQEFITGRVTKLNIDTMWIGMIQDTVNGPYVWVDGTPLTFENWLGGQPDDNSGAELCVEIKTYAGLWSDANCGLSNGYICQKRVGAAPGTPAPTPVLPGGCPNGWKGYGSKCYIGVGFDDGSLRKTWQDAEDYCEGVGGFLASVPNQYYNAFITSQLFAKPNNMWIGLNALNTDRNFKWASNEPVSYTNWAPEEPNNSDGLEECVELRWEPDVAGTWNDNKCSNTLSFICSMPKSTLYPDDPSVNAPLCPPGQGFVQWDTGCYKAYMGSLDQNTWTGAGDKCKADGQRLGIALDLTSVWNVYEQNFLISTFWPQSQGSSFDKIWLGLYFNHNSTNGDTVFSWTDHSPVAYTSWDLNEPQNTAADTGCVYMTDRGAWASSTACQSARYNYVCKYETLTIPPQDPGVGTCSDGWSGLGDYCYKVVSGKNSVNLRSWGDAERECELVNGYLASVHSDVENKAMLSWSGNKDVWIGLNRNGYGGWEWTDLSPVDFTAWANGEPNNAGQDSTGEVCVELWTNGGWNDNYCSDTRGYICKQHKSYSTCSFPSEDRVDCGYDGINSYECVTRGCCWDDAGSGPYKCFYSRDDAACLEKGGTCKDYRYNVCELGYEQGLCSGDGNNRCCFQCSTEDATCNSEVADWNKEDAACEANNYGTCQDQSNYCKSGVYEDGKCGGPGTRQCCVRNPPTLPPDTKTTPPVVPPPGKTTTKPGDTPSQTTSKKTTQPPAATTTPPVNIEKAGGLDGGAIAGIIIAIIFVLVSVGIGIFFFKPEAAKKMKLPTSFGTFGSDPSKGFENPILYSKDAVTVDNQEEFDA